MESLTLSGLSFGLQEIFKYSSIFKTQSINQSAKKCAKKITGHFELFWP